ncbi:hypothetical protein QKW52_12755 [Bacillus sonorensis]|nr:hypothetical protein [Bacillus sonorensis]
MVKTYLRDRAWLMIFSFLGTGFVVAAAWLGVFENEGGVSGDNILYVFILMAAFLVAGFAIDYGRQRSFLLQLKRHQLDVSSMQTGEALKAYQPQTGNSGSGLRLFLKSTKNTGKGLPVFQDSVSSMSILPISGSII